MNLPVTLIDFNNSYVKNELHISTEKQKIEKVAFLPKSGSRIKDVCNLKLGNAKTKAILPVRIQTKGFSARQYTLKYYKDRM
jgi:hypothetical protein